MKKLTATLILAIAVLLPPLLFGETREADAPRALLTILTSDSSETQAMALILTTQYSRAGSEVRVLLCDHAGELAVSASDAGSVAVQPAGRSPRQLLQGLIDAGATVEVCAIFLPGRGLDNDALLEGVEVARPPAIAALMASPHWQLFTL